MRIGIGALARQDPAGFAGFARKKQHQPSIQFTFPSDRTDDRTFKDAFVRHTPDERETSVGSDVLVLFTDWFLQPVDLDVAGLARELVRRGYVTFERMKRT